MVNSRYSAQSEIEEIHQRALDVLQEVGCYFEHEQALEIFKKHGARVDDSTGIVKLPRNLVERSISACPSSMLLAARDPKKDIHAEGDRVYFGPGTLPVKVRDLETGEDPHGHPEGRGEFRQAHRRLGVHSFLEGNAHPH